MGSTAASVLDTQKCVAGADGLCDARGSSTFASPKLFLTEVPEERHPKFCRQS